MHYSDVVGSAFRLPWKYKSMWVLGLFASGMASLPLHLLEKRRDWSGDIPGFIEDIMHDHAEIIVALAALVILTVVVFIVMNLICTAGLIDAVNRLTRGGAYRLRDSFATGLRYFPRFLGINLLLFLGIGFGMFVLIMLIVAAFMIHPALGVLAIMILIPVMFCLIWFFSNVFMLAERAMVVRDVGIEAGLREGYLLFRRNLLPNLVIFLITLGLSMAIAFGVMIIALMFAIPFALVVANSDSGLLLALIIGIPVFAVVSLPISGYLGAVFESLYTMFYFRLVEPPMDLL
jgi:hypothetical protein